MSTRFLRELVALLSKSACRPCRRIYFLVGKDLRKNRPSASRLASPAGAAMAQCCVKPKACNICFNLSR